MDEKIILAFVGLPGAGKSEAAAYLYEKGIPFVRFGELTDEVMQEMGVEQNQDNERFVREKLRKELGMAAYAIKAEPKITQLLHSSQVIAIDGLRSWEEYVYLKEKFKGLKIIALFAEPTIRYERLLNRQIRSIAIEESRKRDIAELEKLNMGGPIAIADFLIMNNDAELENLYKNIDTVLNRLGIHV